MRGYVVKGCVVKGHVMRGCVMRGCVMRGRVMRGCVMRGCVMRGYVVKRIGDERVCGAGHLVCRGDGLVEVRLSGSVHGGRVDKRRHHLRVTPVIRQLRCNS